MSCLCLSVPTCILNIVIFTTQTLSQIKSQVCIGQIQNHFITTNHLTYVTNGKRLGEPRPLTRQHATWWMKTHRQQPHERKRKGIVLFNDGLNPFYLRLYGVGHNYGKEPF